MGNNLLLVMYKHFLCMTMFQHYFNLIIAAFEKIPQ